jgi:predicted secreted protein
MTLTEQDHGRTIQVKMGSVVTLRLKENPTTGYRWTVATAPELEQIGDRFELGGSAIGAAGVRVFEFRATRVGEHELRLKNWREWEGESSVIDRFDAKIVVK